MLSSRCTFDIEAYNSIFCEFYEVSQPYTRNMK